MNDMTPIIAAKSDQLNTDDLVGAPRTIRISEVSVRPGTEQPVTIRYDGDDGRPWKPCKTMSRVLVAAWGPDANKYVGRSVTLYNDPNVTWGGMKVGGIRVSHLSHIDRELTLALTATRGKKAIAKIRPLTEQSAPPAEDKAGKWTDGYIAAIEVCDTLDDLVALENRQAQNVAKLKETRPDLFERLNAASQARAAALSREVKSEEQSGEQFAAEGDF